MDETVVPRAPLDGNQEFDVAIIGAGYTGLWTAYYLLQQKPGCRIAIVEGEVAGGEPVPPCYRGRDTVHGTPARIILVIGQTSLVTVYVVECYLK